MEPEGQNTETPAPVVEPAVDSVPQTTEEDAPAPAEETPAVVVEPADPPADVQPDPHVGDEPTFVPLEEAAQLAEEAAAAGEDPPA